KPRSIATVGYFRGFGAIAVNLSGIVGVAGSWLSEYGGVAWPSLIIALTHIEGSRVYAVFMAVPYNPEWVIGHKPVTIVATVDFSRVKAVPINADSNPPITVNSSDPYGYGYLGSCNGSALYEVEGSNPSGQWYLADCQLFQGPIPQFFIGWSEDTELYSGIISVGFSSVQGYAESGSGGYGVLNITYSTGSSGVELIGPVFQFNQNMNIQLANGLTGVGVLFDPSLPLGTYTESISESNEAVFNVNGPGFVYLYFDGYVAYVSWKLYCSAQTICGWANGTYIIGFNSSTLPSGSNTLYVFPGVDMGNGPIEAMFNGVFKYGVSLVKTPGLYASISGFSNPCGISYSSTLGNVLLYEFSNVASFYNPNPAGIAYIAGDSELTEIGLTALVSIATTFTGYYVPPPASSSTFYVNTEAGVQYSSSSYNFYITFLGINAYNPGSNSVYTWPIGMIINYTNYYQYASTCG
ncbi:hypothetical protein, partial [Caldivirga sp.]|uniref:hypothetical protein n=1 Tax=Caldivirga sp. TaxID=2080243 RepID=UPI0025C1B159